MVLYIAIIGITLFLYERLRPSKPFVSVPKWYFRAISFNLLALIIFLIGSVTWDMWFQNIVLLKIDSRFPDPVKGLLVYVTYHLFFYWWHRIKHENSILWRYFHQIHHSPQRIEVLTANYLHPLDIVSSLIMGSAISYILFGLNIEAAAWFSFYLGSMGYFLHSNIKVPHWVGYFIQTPQMHRLHHEYGKHDSNYCDIVWFDMIFGTYSNPKEICEKCGFDSDKEARVFDMLLCRDIHKKS